jgi:hypothetical protein
VDDASDAQKKKRREVKKEPASDDDHGGNVLGYVRDDGVDLGKQNDRTINGEQTEEASMNTDDAQQGVDVTRHPYHV